MKKVFITGFILIVALVLAIAQNSEKKVYWHNQERTLRYHPDGGDFVITNGNHRFNRALYGTHAASRVETGDLPEFALYMPGMGGNFSFGLINRKNCKWLNHSDKIIARYRPGSMLYEIHDALLGNGEILFTVLALDKAEGMIVRAEFKNVPSTVDLIWAFGGASGKRFSREGDLNVDPESGFYLKPENCVGNIFDIRGNKFTLVYGGSKESPDSKKKASAKQTLIGVFPAAAKLHLADAGNTDSPERLYSSKASEFPVLAGKLSSVSKVAYFLIQKPDSTEIYNYPDLPRVFGQAEAYRQKLAGRVKIETPDPYINTLGGTLAVASDAIWEEPSYLHGAIGWRMRLNGWRGPYTADPLGWHDRARMHFSSYALSQLTSPDSGPSVPDPEKNLARQQEKIGTALFTSGYICRNPNGDFRPNHYDMNLVYIDDLLRHFLWTGDLDYVRKMWPVLQRHLAWEKRNFDGDHDGLYDAYCCIWASDALEYSGSGVAHSSAYNYLANKMAAWLAPLIGENPEPYKKEAEKILNAMNSRLWLQSEGWFAEYQELLGLKRIHPAAALWTVYHTIDSEVPDAFKAYQLTRYVDNQIPHIPVRAKNLPDEGYYLLSTSNWMPYEWSINNVVMAENLHASLAYWQAGRNNSAFQLWKSAILDAMYLGSSPGNFEQMSFYDIRGEAYRDFADEIGIASRSLVEGLFGILPNALDGTLTICPGLPGQWDHAALDIPDISYSFKRSGMADHYHFVLHFGKNLSLKLRLKARTVNVSQVFVNNKPAKWNNIDSAVGRPEIEIDCAPEPIYDVTVSWKGEKPEKAMTDTSIAKGEKFAASFGHAKVLNVFDPQKTLTNLQITPDGISGIANGMEGGRTLFVKMAQGQLSWWEPVCFRIKKPLEISSETGTGLKFRILNNTKSPLLGKVLVNKGRNEFETDFSANSGGSSDKIEVPAVVVVPGSNSVSILNGNEKTDTLITNWNVMSSDTSVYRTVDLSADFNDKVTNIFKNRYLSPRSPYPTLAIPVQGIGNWCSPLMTANIDDSGLRKMAGTNNRICLPQGIPFATPGNADGKNILFTSRWDNYPPEATVPLTGRASHAYLLMAGSTNYMQSRFSNGEVIVEYADGTQDKLVLRNPGTWWPIEQDYFIDGYAFSLAAPHPVRVHLKTGEMTTRLEKEQKIDGGAATVLDLSLDSSRELKDLKLVTLANEVVIGLMAVTLAK